MTDGQAAGGDEAVNRGAMLAALGACRDAIVREMPNMKPTGPLYHVASGDSRPSTRSRPF